MLTFTFVNLVLNKLIEQLKSNDDKIEDAAFAIYGDKGVYTINVVDHIRGDGTPQYIDPFDTYDFKSKVIPEVGKIGSIEIFTKCTSGDDVSVVFTDSQVRTEMAGQFAITNYTENPQYQFDNSYKSIVEYALSVIV